MYKLSITRGAFQLSIVIVLLFVRPTSAQEALCGIQSVHTAAMLLGLDSDFGKLLRPEYVGSDRGSSFAELERAALTLGLHALSAQNLTTCDMRSLKLPVVLHVKTDLASSRYDHFVLFGGMRDGKAIIYDGTNDVTEWTLAEVAARWDGNALVLSREPISLAQVSAPSRWSIGLWAVSIAAVAGIGWVFQKRTLTHPSPAKAGEGIRRGWFSTAARQAAVLLVVAACGAWVFHATSPEGFIVGREGVRTIWGAHASSFLPRIDVQAARELAGSETAPFVDARGPKDYEAGHIPGAVNLPAVTPEAQAVRAAKSLPKDHRLVVYCGNALCHFSYTTAPRLLQAGPEVVVIYSGGWKEWHGPHPDPLPKGEGLRREPLPEGEGEREGEGVR